jgi:hypothetical protein
LLPAEALLFFRRHEFRPEVEGATVRQVIDKEEARFVCFSACEFGLVSVSMAGGLSWLFSRVFRAA